MGQKDNNLHAMLLSTLSLLVQILSTHYWLCSLFHRNNYVAEEFSIFYIISPAIQSNNLFSNATFPTHLALSILIHISKFTKCFTYLIRNFNKRFMPTHHYYHYRSYERQAWVRYYKRWIFLDIFIIILNKQKKKAKSIECCHSFKASNKRFFFSAWNKIRENKTRWKKIWNNARCVNIVFIINAETKQRRSRRNV